MPQHDDQKHKDIVGRKLAEDFNANDVHLGEILKKQVEQLKAMNKLTVFDEVQITGASSAEARKHVGRYGQIYNKMDVVNESGNSYYGVKLYATASKKAQRITLNEKYLLKITR